MPQYESFLKVGKAIDDFRKLVEIHAYSSPFGGYLKISEISPSNNEAVTSSSTALMSANECRAVAKTLNAMADILDENERGGDTADHVRNC
ncbi:MULTISPECIES: hypothetical protein [Shewanella]|uniref:hypothetical protein n=1 Tax=Shewanella TaxID=22 RepID=UPI0031F4EA43